MLKKRVLFLFPRFGIGGISKSLSFVANCCCENGYDVFCLSMSKEKQTVILNDKAKKDYCLYELSGNRFVDTFLKIHFLIKLKRNFGI